MKYIRLLQSLFLSPRFSLAYAVLFALLVSLNPISFVKAGVEATCMDFFEQIGLIGIPKTSAGNILSQFTERDQKKIKSRVSVKVLLVESQKAYDTISQVMKFHDDGTRATYHSAIVVLYGGDIPPNGSLFSVLKRAYSCHTNQKLLDKKDLHLNLIIDNIDSFLATNDSKKTYVTMRNMHRTKNMTYNLHIVSGPEASESEEENHEKVIRFLAEQYIQDISQSTSQSTSSPLTDRKTVLSGTSSATAGQGHATPSHQVGVELPEQYHVSMYTLDGHIMVTPSNWHLKTDAFGMLTFYDRTFNADTYFLSNTYHEPGSFFMLDGQQWKSAEAYFQSQKLKYVTFPFPPVELNQHISRIQACRSGGHAKSTANAILKETGRSIHFRQWNLQKANIMYKAVYAKFSQNPSLKERLLRTYPLILVEDTSQLPMQDKGTHFWGNYGNNSGKNMAGFILSVVRGDLLQAEKK